MNKIIIRETGKSNSAVAVLRKETDTAVIDTWIATLHERPDVYTVELVSVFEVTKNHSDNLHSLMGALLTAYYELRGKVTTTDVFKAFYTTLQGYGLTEGEQQEFKNDNPKP